MVTVAFPGTLSMFRDADDERGNGQLHHVRSVRSSFVSRWKTPFSTRCVSRFRRDTRRRYKVNCAAAARLYSKIRKSNTATFARADGMISRVKTTTRCWRRYLPIKFGLNIRESRLLQPANSLIVISPLFLRYLGSEPIKYRIREGKRKRRRVLNEYSIPRARETDLRVLLAKIGAK